jgi:hypothetical protein
MAELDEFLTGGQPRDELGRFAAKEDAPPASPEPPIEAAPTPESITPAPEMVAAPAPAPDLIPQAALLDERRKRQQYERELQELRKHLETLQAPKPQAEVPQDFWENPQRFIESAREQAVQQALAKADERMRHQFAELCEINARNRYQDYDAVREKFLERVQDDPVLRAELARASDPAEFAYKTGKRLQEVEQFGGLDTYRQRLEAEIRQKIEAEMKAKSAPAVPQSLNAEPSAPAAPVPQGPTPLGSIVSTKFA